MNFEKERTCELEVMNRDVIVVTTSKIKWQKLFV